MKLIMIVLLILTMGISMQGKAQLNGLQKIDSLTDLLHAANEDTNKVKLLINLLNSYPLTDTLTALKYGNQALELSGKLNWRKGIAMTCYNMGLLYSRKQDARRELEFLQRALAAYEELGDKFWIAAALYKIGNKYYKESNNQKALEYFFLVVPLYSEIGDKNMLQSAFSRIGNCYWFLSNYPKALDYYVKALQLAESLGLKKAIASNLGNIGNVYVETLDYPKALEYYIKTVEIFKELKNDRGVATNTMNIGRLYYTQGNFTKAFEYYFPALELSKVSQNKDIEELILGNIGEIYSLQSDYNNALSYCTRALQLCKELNDKEGMAFNYGVIGEIYLHIVQDTSRVHLNKICKGSEVEALSVSKSYFDSSLTVNIEIGQLRYLMENYSRLSKVYELQKEYPLALSSYKEYTKFKDSVYTLEKDKKITQTAMKYEFDKREDSLKLESRKKELSLQKEIEIKALKYEYDKKQATARSEKERQQLKYEHELKRRQIEFNYSQKILKAENEYQQKESERKQRDAIARLNMERKDIINRNFRNSIMLGLIGMIVFSLIVYRQRNKVKREKIKVEFEKARSEELLLNILPGEVAEELKAKGSAEARLIDEATVLFTDFKEFTQIAEKLNAEELVSEINEYFCAFDHIMQKFGIEKIKTIGDSYMAAGGLPAPNKTHAFDVVNAALDIQNTMNELRRKKEAEGRIFFELRIGVHTGPVVAGIVGVKKYSYDIWGDTVNIASRMESSGEIGKVNISGQTYQIIKNHFHCEYRGKISPKGKGEIDMYFVES